MHPSTQEIRRILNLHLALVLDGFTPGPDLGLPGRKAERASWLRRELTGALERSAFAGDAAAAAEAVLAELPRLRDLAREDVAAALHNDPAATCAEEVEACYPGLRAVVVHRLAHRLLQEGPSILPRMLAEYSHSRTGIDLHPGARIGRSFFIDHGTGVVVGETTAIGDRVVLYQGVTLGALNFPRDTSGRVLRVEKRHPTIEDDVVIYSNATILGGDTVIGAGCTIGASVWLTESVPPGTVVVQKRPHLLHLTRKGPEAPLDEP